MPFKPMPFKKFFKMIQGWEWTFEKTGKDWSLYDKQGVFICSVIRQHPGEDVIVAHSVTKVLKEAKERGKK